MAIEYDAIKLEELEELGLVYPPDIGIYPPVYYDRSRETCWQKIYT